MESDRLNTTMEPDLKMTTLLGLPAGFAIVQPRSTTRSASPAPQEPPSACYEGAAEQGTTEPQ